MKNYPKIEYWNHGTFNEHVYAFNKLDGTLIRSEYDKKTSKLNKSNGFIKFGTKKTLIDSNSSEWGNAVNLFMNKYSESLDRIIRTDKMFRDTQKLTIYFEYLGVNSFAGWHEPNDEMDVIMFDVEDFKKGLLIPKLFLKKFGHLDVPELIYEGNYNKQLVEDVRANKYNLSEGVVCKGYKKVKGNDVVWMTKIKTSNWLNKLKGKMGDEYLLNELNGDKSLLNG